VLNISLSEQMQTFVELLALMQVYRFGQLRKAEALAEAVLRGLRAPLHG
jgi:hypothetical protein